MHEGVRLNGPLAREMRQLLAGVYYCDGIAEIYALIHAHYLWQCVEGTATSFCLNFLTIH